MKNLLKDNLESRERVTREQRITLSLSSLSVILAIILLAMVGWQLKGLLLILAIAVVLSASISPLVNLCQRFHIPRWLAVIIVYLSLMGGLAGLGILIGPTVVQQTQLLIKQIPAFLENFRTWLQDLAYRLHAAQPELIPRLINPQSLSNWVIRSVQQLLLRSFGLTRGILGGVLGLLLVVVISGYMVAGSQTLIQGLVELFPHPWNQRLSQQVEPVSRRMGGFIQGRVVVSAILAVLTTIALSLLGLSEFALALGVIAGFTNLIPFIGPVVGTLPAIVVALPKGGLLWLWVLLLFVAIQNLESYVLDPLLVGPSIDIHPLYQLLAVLAGIKLLGIIGALIVPPWVAGAAILIENLYVQPKKVMEAIQTETVT